MLLVLAMLLPSWVSGAYVDNPTRRFFNKHRNLTARQLADTAEAYYRRHDAATALLCYGMVIGSDKGRRDGADRRDVVQALNRSAVIYFYMGDYLRSYELLAKAMDMCEKYGYKRYTSKILVNIGNIYYKFGSFTDALTYYKKALASCRGVPDKVVLLNNIGSVYLDIGRSDAAMRYFMKAYAFSARNGNVYFDGIQNNMALYYRKRGLADSAFACLRRSLAKSPEGSELRALNFMNLGRLHLEAGHADSARVYAERSYKIASDNGFLSVEADGLLLLSDIAGADGDRASAFSLYKKYSALKDSVVNTGRMDGINKIRHLHEIQKAEGQIEQLMLDQYVRQRVMVVAVIGLLVVSSVLVVVFLQKRRLGRSYRLLVEKNVEIMNLYDENRQEKQNKIVADDKDCLGKAHQEWDVPDGLKEKILAVMEDGSVICDAGFSLNVLSAKVGSNHTSVSKAVNICFGKNFRQLLNSYRIKEAMRIMASPDAGLYTIEAIAGKVGFRSRNSFSSVFKDIVGVSPNFYLKSVRDRNMPDESDLQP